MPLNSLPSQTQVGLLTPAFEILSGRLVSYRCTIRIPSIKCRLNLGDITNTSGFIILYTKTPNLKRIFHDQIDRISPTARSTFSISSRLSKSSAYRSISVYITRSFSTKEIFSRTARYAASLPLPSGLDPRRSIP